MKLVQLLLPLTASRESRSGLNQILHELTQRFGGATAFLNSPAQGLWKTGGVEQHDRIVTVEVMVEDFDGDWWRNYRARLERDLGQEEIVIRAMEILKV